MTDRVMDTGLRRYDEERKILAAGLHRHDGQEWIHPKYPKGHYRGAMARQTHSEMT
jgi:hypothetical protein